MWNKVRIMKTYTKKIQALQWTGENLEEFRADERILQASAIRNALALTLEHDEPLVRLGEWFVFLSNGKFVVQQDFFGYTLEEETEGVDHFNDVLQEKLVSLNVAYDDLSSKYREDPYHITWDAMCLVRTKIRMIEDDILPEVARREKKPIEEIVKEEYKDSFEWLGRGLHYIPTERDIEFMKVFGQGSTDGASMMTALSKAADFGPGWNDVHREAINNYIGVKPVSDEVAIDWLRGLVDKIREGRHGECREAYNQADPDYNFAKALSDQSFSIHLAERIKAQEMNHAALLGAHRKLVKRTKKLEDRLDLVAQGLEGTHEV